MIKKLHNIIIDQISYSFVNKKLKNNLYGHTYVLDLNEEMLCLFY